MSRVTTVAPAFFAAAFGAFLAFLWFQLPGFPWVPPVIVGALAVTGYLLHHVGRGRIMTDPVGSIRYLEAWGAVVLALGSFGAGAAIVLAVLGAKLAPDGTPAETKELVSAIIAAVTAFSTAVLVKGLDDFGQLLADKIAGDFDAAFKSRFPPAGPGQQASRGYLALYATDFEGVSGWGVRERRKRATVLADEIAKASAPAVLPQ